MNITDAARQKVQLHEMVLGGVAGDAPDASLIVLHGLGTLGRDFVPMLQQIDVSGLGTVRCLLPNAPQRTISLNGQSMAAWYDAQPVDPRRQTPQPSDENGLRASQRIVQALIDREEARGVPSERIVLMGFSQGAVLALHTGLRAPQRLGGMAALSGYLPLSVRVVQEEARQANQRTPVFMAHGEHDEVVDIGRARAARTTLQAMGHVVHWSSHDMGHEVCEAEVQDLCAWLRRCLSGMTV